MEISDRKDGSLGLSRLLVVDGNVEVFVVPTGTGTAGGSSLFRLLDRFGAERLFRKNGIFFPGNIDGILGDTLFNGGLGADIGFCPSSAAWCSEGIGAWPLGDASVLSWLVAACFAEREGAGLLEGI